MKKNRATTSHIRDRKANRRLSNLYGFSEGSNIIKQRSRMWKTMPTLKSWHGPLLNTRPGTIMRRLKPLEAHTKKLRGEARPLTAELGDRPPWYGGFQSAKGTLAQKMYRYGPQSAKQMTHGEDPHAVIYEKWSPNFLSHPANYHDTWKPPLNGSPQLWPRDASYVCGSKLKRNEEPVREQRARKLLFASMNETKQNVQELRNQLSTLSDLQSTKFRETLRKVRHIRDRAYDSYGYRKESRYDQVKDEQLWSGRGVTVIRATDRDVERLREDKRSEERSKMKWTAIHKLCSDMKSSSYRKAGFQDLENLHLALLNEAENHNMTGQDYMVTREQFLSTVLTSTYGVANRRTLNRIFSSFDPDLNNDVDVREFTGAMRVMWKPSENVSDKLRALFHIFQSEDREDDVISSDSLNIMLSLCSESKMEKVEISTALNRHFSNSPFVSNSKYLEGLKAKDKTVLRIFQKHFMNRLPRHIRSEVERCK
jgi:Ca2+-binding EF-hand superfamily protein